MNKLRISVNIENLGNKVYMLGGYNDRIIVPGRPRSAQLQLIYTF